MKNTFKVDSRTIFHLGREAIEDKILAVSEVVKNSYDADATNCVVEMRYGNELCNIDKIGKIIIRDDGVGMTYNDIVEKWLRIGTENKIQSKFTDKGRRKIGEKGIGRLALNRLGNMIVIYTRQVQSNITCVTINFDNFVNGTYLEDVEVNLKTVDEHHYFDEAQSGTIIEIENLLDNWDLNEIVKLKNKLQNLTNIFELYGPDHETHKMVKRDRKIGFEFDVSLVSDIEIEKSKENNLENLKSYISNALFIYTAEINTKTKEYNYKYSFKPYSEMESIKKRTKKGTQRTEILSTVSRKSVHNMLKDIDDIGIVSVEFFAYDFSSEVLNMSPFSNKKKIKDFVRENGGIRVYRDNHRIFNYGEPDDDWLELNVKRLNRPGDFLSNNVLIGSIVLDANKSRVLKEKTNREGFINDEAFNKFKNVIRQLVFDFSSYVAEDKYNIKREKQENTKRYYEEEVFQDISDSIEDLDGLSKGERQNLLEKVEIGVKQLRTLRDIIINISVNALEFSTIFHDVEKELDNIENLINFNEDNVILLESLQPVLKLVKDRNDILRDKNKKKYNTMELITTILSRKKYLFRRNEIDHEVKFDIDKESKINVVKSDFIRIMDNIISNSEYWLGATNEKKILTEVFYDNDNLHIKISDNGPGFDGEIDYLIQPFVTKKIADEGIGLGTFIIETLVQKHKGKVIFSNNSSLCSSSASVEIVLKEVK